MTLELEVVEHDDANKSASQEVAEVTANSSPTAQTPYTPHIPRALSDKEQARLQKLTKRLRREVGQAIVDFNMIEEGDRIMVCLSGGKDSYTLLDLLINLQKYAPINFSIIAVNIDQQQPGFPKEVLPNYLQSIGVEYRIVNEDTYSVVKSIIAEGKTTCSLCSRLRRGIIYRIAQEEKCTKIALGHHRDDMIETLFLNMFFAGKMKSMPAKLVSDNNLHTVIRPLAYCREKDIIKYAELKDFPIIPCNLCGSQPNLQRAVIKQMLNEWDAKYPGRIETIFKAMQDVVPSHLHDLDLYDFVNIASESEQQLRPTGATSRVNILASSKDGVITSDIRASRAASATPVVDPRPNRSKEHLLAKQEHMLVAQDGQLATTNNQEAQQLGAGQQQAQLATKQASEQVIENLVAGQVNSQVATDQQVASKDIVAQQQDDYYNQALAKYATREACADNMDYLDELAAQELFGTTDYNALALMQEEQAKKDELEISDEVTIPGLKIKQL